MSEETKKPPLRLGVGGPVGAGKTSLVKSLCLEMRQKFNLAVITNDIYTREDAEFLLKHGFVDRVVQRKDLQKEVGNLLSILLRKNSDIHLENLNENSETDIQTREAS